MTVLENESQWVLSPIEVLRCSCWRNKRSFRMVTVEEIKENQSKLKRQASSPLLDCAIENVNEGHTNKIPRAGTANDTFCNSTKTQQTQQSQSSQQSGIPSFSVQIVQQFSSNTSQSHSQTIQTNVTVQALSNNNIKTSNSPLASNVVSTSSPGCAGSGASANDSYNQIPNSTANNTGAIPSTTISVGTNVECKQEPDTNFAQCSVNGSRPLPELNGELTSANNNTNNTTSSTAATTGERFSDSLANLGFPEDSNDDVIHPDILKDIIDDVFTNPSDLINGFNFVDSMGIKDSNQNDEKDSLKPMLSLTKSMQNSPPNNFQNSANSPNIYNMNQSQQSVFDFQTLVNSNNNSQTVPNNSNSLTQGFQAGRLGSYVSSSPNLPGISNNGLGLDFKLTEPSPAAQTLKQMAEQHQSMQQKQQQLSLGIGANHPRSPFGSDSFPDPISNIRTNFINGSPTSLQKSPTGLFQPMGFSQTQNFTSNSGSAVKQEVVTPNTPIYQPNMNQHLSDLELHKRRQVMQMQQSQMGTITRPPFSHSPDQKRSYQGMRLPHYNDPSPSHPPNEGSASNSPVPHLPGQFIRGVSTPGVTPPPQGFGSSPSPSSSSTLHLSQSQQIQMSANNQQIQISQSQQHLIMNQDKKPTIMGQQQQQSLQSRGFYPGQSSLHMSQSQSMSFQFPNSTIIRGNNTIPNQRSNAANHPVINQRHINHQYMSKPPPDYQASMEPNNHIMQTNSMCPNNPIQINFADSLNTSGDHSGRTVDQRIPIPVSLSQSYNMINSTDTTVRAYSGMIPLNQLYPDIFTSNNNNNNVLTSRSHPGQSHSSASSNARRQYGGLLPMSDLMSRPCSGESPNDNSSNVDPPFPGISPINELIPRSCANDSLSNTNVRKNFSGLLPMNDMTSRPDDTTSNNNSNIERSFSSIPISDLIARNNPDVLNSNKPISESSDRSFPGVTSIRDLSHDRPYPGAIPIDDSLSISRGCSNSGATSSANSTVVSKSYSSAAYSHSASVSGPYPSMSSVSVMSGQVYSQTSQSVLTNPAVSTTAATIKGRGKQSGSRANNKQNNLQRQQKPPNVNVGPDGLNISQKPPTVSTDWRQAYVQHNQHQMVSNGRDDVIVTYSRSGNQAYENVNNSGVNNFQTGHANSRSPAGDNSSLLSVAQSASQSQIQSSNIHTDVETPTSNQIMMQSQTLSINNSNSFQNSQIQLSGVSNSDMNQSSIFTTSPSPNNSLQNIVTDSSQFNLDFLDNMDCSTSDLLNFDDMQGEGCNFPILDDIAMLDK